MNDNRKKALTVMSCLVLSLAVTDRITHAAQTTDNKTAAATVTSTPAGTKPATTLAELIALNDRIALLEAKKREADLLSDIAAKKQKTFPSAAAKKTPPPSLSGGTFSLVAVESYGDVKRAVISTAQGERSVCVGESVSGWKVTDISSTALALKKGKRRKTLPLIRQVPDGSLPVLPGNRGTGIQNVPRIPMPSDSRNNPSNHSNR